MGTTLQKWRKKDVWRAYFLVGPSILGLLLFFYIALGFSFFISFTHWSALDTPTFAGMDNYLRALVDPQIGQSLVNTLVYVAISVPIGVTVSFVYALILHAIPRFKSTFRLFFFLPFLTLPVALALVWKWMFNKSFGVFNTVLHTFNLPGVDWLGSRGVALWSIVFFSVVTGMGYGIIIFLAGLKNINQEYYDAAKMDGASGFTVIRRITVPLVTPTIFFLVVTDIISAFQVFDPIYIMTKGGPADSTRSIMFSIYQEGFTYYRFGDASAVAWILFAIIMAVTAVQLYGQKKWVHYE